MRFIKIYFIFLFPIIGAIAVWIFLINNRKSCSIKIHHGEVPPFPMSRKDVPTLNKIDGKIVFTKEYLLAKIDKHVVHGIIRRFGDDCSLVLEALIENEEDIDVRTGRVGQKRVFFQIHVDDSTLIDNRQKVSNFNISGKEPQFLSFDDLKRNDIVIVFSKNEVPIIHQKSFIAGRILVQSDKYRDLIQPSFASQGINL